MSGEGGFAQVDGVLIGVVRFLSCVELLLRLLVDLMAILRLVVVVVGGAGGKRLVAAVVVELVGELVVGEVGLLVWLLMSVANVVQARGLVEHCVVYHCVWLVGIEMAHILHNRRLVS